MQALIATAIAIAIAAVGVKSYVQQQVVTARQSVGKAQGGQLDVLAIATEDYTTQNYATLTSGVGAILHADGVTAGTVANALAPTVQELVTLGYLQASFSATNYFGGGYVVGLETVPTGCAYPGCGISGSVSLTNPITRSGTPDSITIGAALQRIGADGGTSNADNPDTLSGVAGGWSLPNPAGAVAGILAERVGQGAQRYTLFLPRSGALPMTGTLQAAGNSITTRNTAGTVFEVLTANGYVVMGNTINQGDSCAGMAGAIAKDAAGHPYVCQ